MRAFLAFLYGLLLTPMVVLAQGQAPSPYGPAREAGGRADWVVWVVVAAAVVIALIAWGRRRDRAARRPPGAR
jgi:hypothetical protein